MKKFLGILLTVMLLVTSLVCVASADAQTELRFAGFCAEDGTVGSLYFPELEKFYAENPDIKIINDYAYDDDLKTKIKSEAAADSLPDVICYWATLANSSWLYASNKVLSTQEIMDSIDGFSMDMIDESIQKAISFDGVAYGLPLNTLRMCFIVNKKIYEECGVKLPNEYEVYTYDQFRADGEIFKAKGYIPLTIGYKGGNPGHYYLAELISQMPGGLDELYGMLEYKNPAGSGNLAAAMKIVQEDISLGLYPQDFLNASWSEMHALYCDQKAAAMYTIASSAAPLMLEDPDLMEVSVVVPFPQIEGCVSAPSTRCARSVNWSIHISRKSWEDPTKQEAIKKFVKWFFNEDWQKTYATLEEPAMKFGFDIKDSFGPFYREVLDVQDGWSYSPYYLSAVPDSSVFTAFKDAVMEAAMLATTPEQFEEKAVEVFDELQYVKP